MFGRRRKRAGTPPARHALADSSEGVTILPGPAERPAERAAEHVAGHAAGEVGTPTTAPGTEPAVTPSSVDVNPSAQVLDELRGFFGGRSSRRDERTRDRTGGHGDTDIGRHRSNVPPDEGSGADQRDAVPPPAATPATAESAPFDAAATEGVRIVSAPAPRPARAPETQPSAADQPASAPVDALAPAAPVPKPRSTSTSTPTAEPATAQRTPPAPAADPRPDATPTAAEPSAEQGRAATPASAPAAATPQRPASISAPSRPIPGEPLAVWAPPKPIDPLVDPPTEVLPVTAPAVDPPTEVLAVTAPDVGPTAAAATVPATIEPAQTVPTADLSAPGVSAADDAATPPRSTITIVDDTDLPDAVYLDSPDLDGEAAVPARVFIDDGHADHANEPVAVAGAAAPARIEPRLRDRRAQIKKESRKRRLKWVSVVAIVVGAALVSLVVLGSSLFAVDDVHIEGVAYSAGPEFDDVLEDLVGTNVFRVDTGAIATRLESIPWVESARVNVRFPGSATIEVRERTPAVAYLGADNRYRVLDGKGRVITVIAGRPTDYIEVYVDNPLDLEPGMTAPLGYTAAATLATMLPTLGPAVAEIHAKQDGSDLWMLLRTVGNSGAPHEIRVRLGVADNLEGKLARLLAELETRGDGIRNITSIDVSTRNTITS